MAKRILQLEMVGTVGDLLNELNRMLTTVACERAEFMGRERDTTYVTINSDSIRLTLVEETLSDKSVVYNIELSEASK